jgi:hypothetical protein
LRYSPSTGGFYPEAICYSHLPSDLVTISEAEHEALMTAQARGHLIETDGDGKPVSIERVVTAATEAQEALRQSDVVILRCVEHGVAVPAEWRAYRAALRAFIQGHGSSLPDPPPFPSGT